MGNGPMETRHRAHDRSSLGRRWPHQPANAAVLCGPHHTLIHAGDWQIRMATDGHPEVIPPTWIDPRQRPRRNMLHRRL